MTYSVLMSVYHREQAPFLREAMDSIWRQTVPTEDFVLVCDGPLTPELDAVIAEMEAAHPSALHVVRLEKNSGLGIALNEGLKYCRNDLVARMDSDDISMPDRCERQLAAFEARPSLALCSGTLEEFWGDTVSGRRVLPEDQEGIIAFSRKRNPFSHPAIMFRKSEVERAGGYNEEFHLFEDYYLWVRMLMNGCEGCNLPQVLLRMRVPTDLYERRGGRQYARDLLRFHRWLREQGWATRKDYLTGALPHAIVCIIPNKMRKGVYRLIRRA